MTMLLAFIFSFAVLLLVILGMAIGVMNGRPAISGSCGGLNGKGCELCSGSCEKRAATNSGEES